MERTTGIEPAWLGVWPRLGVGIRDRYGTEGCVLWSPAEALASWRRMPMTSSKVTTTLGVYAHLFNTDDFADATAALGAMQAQPLYAESVVPLRR